MCDNQFIVFCMKKVLNFNNIRTGYNFIEIQECETLKAGFLHENMMVKKASP